MPELGLVLLAYQLVQRLGLANLPPVTLGLIALQVETPSLPLPLCKVGVYLQLVVVPRTCLSGEAVWHGGDWLR